MQEDQTRVARLNARLVELEEDNRRISLAYDLMREGVGKVIEERNKAREVARELLVRPTWKDTVDEYRARYPWLAAE